MDPVVWLVVTPLAAVLVLLIRSRPGARRVALVRYARRVDLPVPPELHPRVEPLLAARTSATELGAIGGAAAVFFWAAIARPLVADGSLWVLVLLGALFTGGAVGAGVSGAREVARRPDPDEPRVARPTVVTLADYVAPLELHGARVVALLPTLTILIAWLAGSASGAVAVEAVLTAGPVSVALIALAVVVGSEVAGRRLLAKPQTAGSDLELAWSDALRARVLRDLYTAPIVVGAYATFGVAVILGDAIIDDTLRIVASGAVGGLVLGAVGIAVASTASRPHRHFRRQLWPRLDVEAGRAR